MRLTITNLTSNRSSSLGVKNSAVFLSRSFRNLFFFRLNLPLMRLPHERDDQSQKTNCRVVASELSLPSCRCQVVAFKLLLKLSLPREEEEMESVYYLRIAIEMRLNFPNCPLPLLQVSTQQLGSDKVEATTWQGQRVTCNLHCRPIWPNENTRSSKNNLCPLQN